MGPEFGTLLASTPVVGLVGTVSGVLITKVFDWLTHRDKTNTERTEQENRTTLNQHDQLLTESANYREELRRDFERVNRRLRDVESARDDLERVVDELRAVVIQLDFANQALIKLLEHHKVEIPQGMRPTIPPLHPLSPRSTSDSGSSE